MSINNQRRGLTDKPLLFT